jgi:hypothetical protein
LGYKPQLAVTITFGFESDILPASYVAEKPPNTMECIAPILAQAQAANNAYGIIGS